MSTAASRFLVGITIVMSIFVSACASPPDEQAMIAAAKAVDQTWLDTFNKGDIEALMALYWKDPSLLVYPSDGMELRGWEEVANSYRGMMSYMRGATATYGEIRYTVAGDMVVGFGRWTITVPTPEGPVFEINGRFSDVKAEKDGKWVIIMEHGSVPMPRPPDASM